MLFIKILMSISLYETATVRAMALQARRLRKNLGLAKNEENEVLKRVVYCDFLC